MRLRNARDKMRTLAEKLQIIQALLEPEIIEYDIHGEPFVIGHGEPLISKEEAFMLLNIEEMPEIK